MTPVELLAIATLAVCAFGLTAVTLHDALNPNDGAAE